MMSISAVYPAYGFINPFEHVPRALRGDDEGTCVNEYPTLEEFTAILRGDTYSDLVDVILAAESPFAFKDDPALYVRLCDQLRADLRLAIDHLVMVGSGKIGFSTNPNHYGRAFRPRSDLDIAVVSSAIFDRVWFFLLSFPRSRLATFDEQEREWLRSHRENRIFHGRCEPAHLLKVPGLSRSWFVAFKNTSLIPELAAHDVHGMLFRTWEHLRLYHEYGLREVRRVQGWVGRR
jgi:hypothetical protein